MGDEGDRRPYRRDDDGKHEISSDQVAFLLMDREQFRLDKQYVRKCDSIQLDLVGCCRICAHIACRAGTAPCP